MPEGGEKKCRNDRSDRVHTPAVPTLPTDDSVTNTQSKRQNATRSMTETLLYAVGTDGHGNESVTVILPLTLCAKSVRSTGRLPRHRKYTISNRCRRAALTHRATLWLCVHRVTLASLPRWVTVGTTDENTVQKSSKRNRIQNKRNLSSHHPPPGAVKISATFDSVNGRGVTCAKKAYSNG